MKEFTLKFHLEDSGYLTALRLVTGAVCSLKDVDVDATEDFKVCVTESVLLIKAGGFESVVCSFLGGNLVQCEISGEGGAPCAENGSESEFSLALISALVKECDISRRGAVIEKVKLTL